MSGNNKTEFLDKEFAELEITAANFAQRFISDEKIRQQYTESIRKFSDELQNKVKLNHISPQHAALQAQNMRNTIMDSFRGKTSDIGLAIARFLKKEGKTLLLLELKYSQELYKLDFSKLSIDQRNDVWRKIIAKAGETQVHASNGAKWLGRAGKGLFVLTIVIAVYHIAVAEDKVRATANEGVAIGGGIAGSAALGAVGLLCGPAAIACVPLGIFVGGILGAFGADFVFDELWQ